MKKFYFAILALVVCLSSCKKDTPKEIIQVPALRASSIYKQDSVYYYIQKFKDTHKAIAESYSVKAQETEESNPQKAIHFYKRAITVHPTLETYKKLAALLNKNKMFKEARDLYYLIVNKTYIPTTIHPIEVYLFGEPDEETVYEYIMTGIMEKNKADAYAVYHAKEVMGMDIAELKGKLLKDERFKYDTSSIVFKNIMLQFMTQEEVEKFKTNSGLFNNLLNSIKDSSNIFEIGERQVKEFDYHFNRMDFYEEDYQGMDISALYNYYLQEEHDNPKGWYNYNFTHKMSISDSVVALIYAIDTSASACPKDMRHIYHRLVTYNRLGKILDSEIVAVQAGEVLKTMKYSGGKFAVRQHQRTWAKPYHKYDFDNDVVRVEAFAEKEFKINSKGIIEEVSEAVAN